MLFLYVIYFLAPISVLYYLCIRNIILKKTDLKTINSLGITLFTALITFIIKAIVKDKFEPLYFEVVIIAISVIIYLIRVKRDKTLNKKTLLTKFKIKVGVGVLCYIILMFVLGYKIPWFDKHPTWKEFPYLTNKAIVIEEIKNFDKLYGNKYKIIPEPKTIYDSYNFESSYRNNLKNIKTIDYRITGNEFEYYGFFSFSGLRGGGNSTGASNNSCYNGGSFSQNGYEYLEFTLNNERGYFKAKNSSTNTELESFYQYNYPKKQNDTLFFNYRGDKFRAYLKK